MSRHLAALGMCALIAIGACSVTNVEDPMRRPLPTPGLALPDTAPLELGPTPSDESVAFSVSLRLPGAAELDAYLAGLTQPDSPYYRRFLAPGDFGARFGLSDAGIARITDWLRAGGLEVDPLPQRTSIAVAGSARQVNRLLGVTLVDRQAIDGTRYHVPVGEPAVPTELTDDVAAIVGLNTQPVIRPALGGILASGVPAGGLTPDLVARAYEIAPLHEAGLMGDGLSIAIVSFDTFTPNDVTRFDRQMGITGGPPVESVRLPGAPTAPGGGSIEVALDIQVIRGIAPHAQLINYEGPNNAQGFVPIIARIVAEARVNIVSISWGSCENRDSPSSVAAEDNELAAAFAAGISIFVAAGDDGAFDCRRVDISDDPFERDLSPGVDWPSASTNVVAVGGTFLSTREDGSYLGEAGWEEPLGGGGGGGGLSRIQPRPAWQQGNGVDNAQSNGMRQVPDVAGPADPSSGFSVGFTDPDSGFVNAQIGGTSAAAPFWAASMLLAEQLAQQSGVTSIGPLGPTLYQVAAQQPPGAVFHDVVRGGNLLYQAGPGWDYSTGLGSPRVAPLAQAIVDFLRLGQPGG